MLYCADMKEFLTLQEVAEWLGVSEKTVSRLILSGRLPATRVGGVYRIRLGDLEEYIERQKVVPLPNSELMDAGARHALVTAESTAISSQGVQSCGRCQRLLKGPASRAGKCQESTCDLPLCRICWSNEFDKRCRQHKLGFQEKLSLARERLSRGEIKSLITAEEARKKEFIFIQRFDQKIREAPYIVSPLDGVKYPVSSWEALHVQTSELNQARLASLRLLQPELDSLSLPQNLTTCYSWPSKNTRGSQRGGKFSICASVMSDLTEMATNGFSATPVSRAALLKILEEKAAANKASDSFLILCLASMTGWDKEAREMIEGSTTSSSFSSLYVAPCLMDFQDNSLLFNPLDKRLKPFIPLYRGELDYEMIYRIAEWVRQQLFRDKISLTLKETGDKFGVEASLMKEAYLLLEEEGGYIIDMIPGFGLTISRKL